MDSQQPNDIPNPHMAIPNPYEDLQKGLEAMNLMYPELQEIGRICYDFFIVSTEGQKLWEMLEKKYIMGNQVNPMLVNCAETALYWTGFIDCLKFLRQSAMQHKQRVIAV